MHIVGQDVPSALFSDYCKALKPAFQKWSNRFKAFSFGPRRFGVGPDIYYMGKRSPFRIPHLQSKSLNCPSGDQIAVRMAFKRCCMAYNAADRLVEFLDVFGNGPMSRHYWYNIAIPWGMWYYNFFMSLTWLLLYEGEPPSWCKSYYFTGSMVGMAPWWDPNENYSDYDDWKVSEYYDMFGGMTSQTWLFLQKNDEYPTNRWSTFILNCHGNQPVYVDVYGVPFNDDLTKITWNNKPPLGPKIGTYLVPGDGTYFNFHTYPQGQYNLLDSSIWRTICIKVNRPFYTPPWHNIAGFVCKSSVAMIDERTYLTP